MVDTEVGRYHKDACNSNKLTGSEVDQKCSEESVTVAIAALAD